MNGYTEAVQKNSLACEAIRSPAEALGITWFKGKESLCIRGTFFGPPEYCLCCREINDMIDKIS
ncbi:hypothetical protein CLOM621_05577 [Clostridium sp. M62/1]|nr:hypothetical protein CLOM621_05577 [Clostridium sp. M62/1]